MGGQGWGGGGSGGPAPAQLRGGEGRFKGQSSLQPGRPQICWGKWGEAPRKSDPSPHLQLALAPTSSLLAPEVQRVTLTSPGSHTHTHTRCGGFWFLFFKKHVYKKQKKRYIRNRGRRRDIANVRSGREGVGDRRQEGAGAAEKREGQRAGCRWEVLTVHVPLVFILDEGIAPGLS